MADYERVLCVKNEVFVFKIPPRTTNRGYRAADWKLDNPDWTGRMRVVTFQKQLTIKLEDRISGELFAKAPIEEYPGVAVEQVIDSSRYFVLQIKDDGGRKAFIGIGFTDRGDSFDLNVALQDHFKQVRREEDEVANAAKFASEPAPKLDLGFKAGQTIKINLNTKRQGEEGEAKARPRAQGGGSGLLPPPPGSKVIAPPTAAAAPVKQQAFSQPPQPQAPIQPSSSGAATGNVDLLGGFGAPAQTNSQPAATSDPWGDFIGSSNSNTNSGSSTDWVNFN